MDKGIKILIIIAGLLLLLVIYLIVHLAVMKREMKKIRNELKQTRKRGYDRQITVTLIDKDFSLMTSEINKNLDFQKQLKLESEKAERRLKQSISNIAHDLRTPLTVVKGNLQMLEKNKGLTRQSEEYLRLAIEKTDALRMMIDDFFELSVLESDNVPVEIKEIDITETVMQFLISHESVIRNNGLTPKFDFPEKSIFVCADEEYLQRIFSNLMNNIVKYATDSFLVSLKNWQEDGKEICTISFANEIDEGGHIDVEYLFDRTYRGDKARHGQGAGLGLYIVKLLVQKQGAEVWAKIEGNMLYITIMFQKLDFE